MSAASLPDAAPGNWVDRHAPEGWRPWLKLGRFDRPTGIWLLMLPGWQGIALAGAAAGRWPDPWLLLLFAIGAAAMRAAGCAWNDVVDRDLDRQVARTAARPVASGRISRRAAVVFTAAMTTIGAAVLLFLPPICLALALASLVLVALYPLMKRVTWWPQAWLGLTFNWGALMGFAAVTSTSLLSWLYVGRAAPLDQQASAWIDGAIRSLNMLWPSALLLYAGGIAWTLGYDTIYAAQDVEDDALAGVKSSARRLGTAAPMAVAAFYAVATALALAAGVVAQLGLLFFAVWGLYALHLAWQVRRFRLGDPARALAVFMSNRDAGVLLFLAIAAGAWR